MASGSMGGRAGRKGSAAAHSRARGIAASPRAEGALDHAIITAGMSKDSIIQGHRRRHQPVLLGSRAAME